MRGLIQGQRGSAVVIAIAVALFLVLVIAGLMPMLSQELKAGQLDRDILETRYVAEAGVKHALRVLTDKGDRSIFAQANSFAGNANKTYEVKIYKPDGTLLSDRESLADDTTYTIVSDGQIVNSGVPGGPTWRARDTYTTPASVLKSWQTAPAYGGGGLTVNAGVTVTGGTLQTALKKGNNKVINNGGFDIKYEAPIALPTISGMGVSLNAGDYSQKGFPAPPANNGTNNLSGTYYAAGSYNTNSGVKLKATGGGTVTIYAGGTMSFNDTISTDSATTLRIICAGNIGLNSGATVTGNVQVFAGGNMTVDGKFTGYSLIMSNGNITLNSGCVINKGVVIAAGNLDVNGKVTGQVLAGGTLTLNSGATVIFDTTIFSSTGWPVP